MNCNRYNPDDGNISGYDVVGDSGDGEGDAIGGKWEHTDFTWGARMLLVSHTSSAVHHTMV